jgi:alpha-L-fucosidase
LTNYGKIDYLWFDGCGSEGHEYDKPRIVKAIRDLQPDILIFNMWDPDTRWVGNEAGAAGVCNISQINELDFSVLTGEKQELGETRFLPAECDFMMRERNWFYSELDEHTVKSVEELVGLYYHSVGSGANFLINIGPDRRGLLPDADAARLLAFGEEIRRRFDTPIPSSILREEKDELVLALESERLINHVVLSEDLSEGEGVLAFSVWLRSRLITRPVCVHMGAAIGHKRIVSFPAIRAKEVIVRVTRARGAYRLKKPEGYWVE